MNPSLIKAAKEVAERSGQSFRDVLATLAVNWSSLTGQPVYITNATPSSTDSSVSNWCESLDDLY